MFLERFTLVNLKCAVGPSGKCEITIASWFGSRIQYMLKVAFQINGAMEYAQSIYEILWSCNKCSSQREKVQFLFSVLGEATLI